MQYQSLKYQSLTSTKLKTQRRFDARLRESNQSSNKPNSVVSVDMAMNPYLET